MYEELLNAIKESDRILVGIGNEAGIEPYNNFDTSMELRDVINFMAKLDNEGPKLHSFYNSLARIMRDKDYFVITTNIDGIISQCDLIGIKTVAPCGSIHKVQCGCAEVSDVPKDFFDNNCICPKCGQEYRINVYNRQKYNESGYLKQWNMYNMWLSGTIGKKLLILELGCDFTLPTLIRIPFERIAMINQKAVYYRVSEKYPQITAELNDKMHSININPIQLVADLDRITLL